jgi:hypothetical protein
MRLSRVRTSASSSRSPEKRSSSVVVRSEHARACKGKQGRRDNRLAANCAAVKKPMGSISTNQFVIPPPNWSYLHSLVVAPPIGSISTNQLVIPPPCLHQLVVAPPIGFISTDQLVIPPPRTNRWSCDLLVELRPVGGGNYYRLVGRDRTNGWSYDRLAEL